MGTAEPMPPAVVLLVSPERLRTCLWQPRCQRSPVLANVCTQSLCSSCGSFCYFVSVFRARQRGGGRNTKPRCSQTTAQAAWLSRVASPPFWPGFRIALCRVSLASFCSHTHLPCCVS